MFGVPPIGVYNQNTMGEWQFLARESIYHRPMLIVRYIVLSPVHLTVCLSVRQDGSVKTEDGEIFTAR